MVITSSLRTEPHRLLLGGAEGIGGAHREAVHVGAIEARHVYICAHVLGQDAPECFVERHTLELEHRNVDRGVPTPLGLVAVDHFEELTLLHVGCSSS